MPMTIRRLDLYGMLALPAPSRPGLRQRLRLALHAWRTRTQLARLDDRMLSDIGISRAEALAEADRAPWDFAARRRSEPTRPAC
jgi:uncharacterized protein YjiS (DUF1127 family)